MSMHRAAIVSPCARRRHLRREPARPCRSRNWARCDQGAGGAHRDRPERIDDVCFAQGYANGETPCIARWTALAAGLPIGVPGYQLDRRCGGGLQAVIDAAMMVQTGAADVVVAGGVESMSNVEYYTRHALGRAGRHR